MKNILLLIVAMLMAVAVQAVPAYPNPVKVQQPDGTYVTIKLHGDEWLSFTTTEDGYSVVKDNRGYYVYAELKDQQLLPTSHVAHDALQRSAAEKVFLANVKKYQAPAMKADVGKMKEQMQQQQRRALASRRTTNFDSFRGLVILVQFNDKPFSRDDYSQIANDMLNKENYTGFDSEVYTGSVHDYFVDNSKGKFKPQFDVVGPYTIDYSQYDPQKMSNAQAIVSAAVEAADADVDFSQYDLDGDGKVDLVYFIIAGNGSNYTGNDSGLWWPHRSNIKNVTKDGVRLWDYASSVELCGWLSQPESVKIDGIGTICHEFSHVLGLPDFYDTDYEGSGGQSLDPGKWSVMANGSYFNDGRTPVGYSLYERYSVGFTDAPSLINEKKAYTLEPLHVNQKGYRINSPVDNEFFLLENRQNDGSFKWDVYLPGSGLLVHRVDMTNQSVWNDNTINANPAYNYYEVIWAGGAEKARSGYDTYPGLGNVTELNNLTMPANLLTHDGSNTAWGLSNIREEGGSILFNITSGGGPVKPANVTASNITGTSATITWTGVNDKYHVRYRTAGQDATVFEDDFESGLSQWTIYTEGEARSSNGWFVTNPNNGVGVPAHGGNYVASSWSWNSDSYHADNWLITPQVIIGNELRFWVRVNIGYPDSYEVLLSTTGNAISDFTVTLQALAAAPANGEWNEVVIDLSAYAGRLGYIAIHHADYDKNYLLIDDFGIYAEAKAAGEWQTKSTTQSNVVLTGLTLMTPYEVQVQAETTEAMSDWSAMTVFSTILLPGDVNDDGVVDVADAVCIVNHIIGNPNTMFVEEVADVNNDKVVNIADALQIVNFVIGN